MITGLHSRLRGWLYRLAPLLPLLPGLVAAPSDAPYVPEPHGGAWAVTRSATRQAQVMDLQAPAAQWTRVDGGRGRLPQGWNEHSTPVAPDTRYSRVIEDGIPLLRWEVHPWEGETRPGIATRIGAISRGDSLRVTVTLRSPTRAPAELALVRDGAPANVIRSLSLEAGAGWTTRELTWQVPADTDAVLVSLALGRPGTIEIMDLSVEVVDAARLDLALKDERLAPLDKNLLRATRFPLGLPPRWMIARDLSDGDEVTVSADASMIGPSGSPALRISPGPGVKSRVMGEPFACLRPGAVHVASLSIRGRGKARLSVFAGDQVLAARDFPVSADAWSRISLPFTPRSHGDALNLMIENDGELWIDALRAAPGDGAGASAYDSGFATEVALSSNRPERIVFTDEAQDIPVVRWAVTGPVPNGARLRAKVVNLYDRQIELPAPALATGDAAILGGEWPLPAFSGQPHGAFRFEAWVENAAGQRISPYEEVVVNRLPRPRRWGEDAPDSPFGAHLLSANRHLEIAKSIGVNWVRLHDAGIQYVGWFFLERERGLWSFRDEAVDRYRAHHLMILGQLGTAPAWATALRRTGPHSWTDRYYQPEDMDAFRDYVDTVTRRYRESIRHWEIWNEPWLAEFWKKDLRRDADGRTQVVMGDDPAGDFARLQRTAYEAAKHVDPGLVIVGFNSTGGNHAVPGSKIAGEEWTRSLRDNGALGSADVVSYHQYVFEHPGYAGDSLEKGFDITTRPLRDEQGRLPRPVWMTEGSAVQKMTGPGFYYHSLPFPSADTDHRTADRLLRHVTGVLAAGAEKVFLYSMHKLGRHGDNGFPYRLLLSEDGYPHPTAVAYAALAWRLEGKRFVETIELKSGVRACVFANDAAWTTVMMPRPGTPFSVPSNQRDAFSPEDLYGNPLPTDAPLNDEVFFLSGKGAFPRARMEAGEEPR